MDSYDVQQRVAEVLLECVGGAGAPDANQRVEDIANKLGRLAFTSSDTATQVEALIVRANAKGMKVRKVEWGDVVDVTIECGKLLGGIVAALHAPTMTLADWWSGAEAGFAGLNVAKKVIELFTPLDETEAAVIWALYDPTAADATATSATISERARIPIAEVQKALDRLSTVNPKVVSAEAANYRLNQKVLFRFA
jgi:hypothetical protein